MNKTLLTVYLGLIGALAPLTTYAQNLEGIIRRLTRLLDSAILTFASLAVFFFIWGMFQYMLNLENEEKRKDGRAFMIWSIIALTFIFALWGFVSIIQWSLFL